MMSARLAVGILASILLCACANVPSAEEFRRTSAVLAAPREAGEAKDARPQFRQVYCQVVHRESSSADPRCESSLWRLSDEGPAPAQVPLPEPRTDLRLLVVPGSFNDCLGPDGLPFTDGIERLRSRGVRIDIVPVSGRSSSEHNARQIADFLAASDLRHSEPIVLLGYSKGAVDAVQFLGTFPQYARRIAGIVAVAGPIWGSPLADSDEWLYDSMLANAFADRCNPGDAGLLHSLRTDVRADWNRAHPMPADIHYYFVSAFTTSGHLARGLRPMWRSLASTDTRNDGQVRLGDQVQPGGILLGYANADHWGIAVQVEKQLDYLAQRAEGNDFPQSALLEAIWLYVGAALPPARELQ
jgi:hypothetical protein